MRRRDCLLAGAVASIELQAYAAAVALRVPTSLADELAQALKKPSPLLVMVSLEGCPFCKIARENYLAPLQRQQDLALVQINMRSHAVVQDFSDIHRTHDELIRRWGITVAPSILFFGLGGLEVAERLIGGYLPDFYGAYLDERLRVARAAI